MTCPELAIDVDRETARITEFIRSELAAAGRRSAVLGLSGGVDSAAVAFLCTRALGADRVLAFCLPCATSSRASVDDALAAARACGASCDTIDITPAVKGLAAALPTTDRLRLGNRMARVRMTLLYDLSAAHDALVAGTGNRTESLLGYTTLHGDSACAFAPILHLYKCQVRQLAAHLGVPERIIAKPPSADLWDGQTDEGELGFTYDQADRLLHHLIDERKSDDELRALGFSADLVARLRHMIGRSEFKRRMPHCLPPSG